MEEAFGNLAQGEADPRGVFLCGKVLTARRLGSVLFLSADHVSPFRIFPPSPVTSIIPSTLSPNNPSQNTIPHTSIQETPSTTQNTPHNTHIEDTRTEPEIPTLDKNLFEKAYAEEGELLEVSAHAVLQVVLAKDSFKGEIRENENGKQEIVESLKDLSRTISMGHAVGISLLLSPFFQLPSLAVE